MQLSDDPIGEVPGHTSPDHSLSLNHEAEIAAGFTNTLKPAPDSLDANIQAEKIKVQRTQIALAACQMDDDTVNAMPLSKADERRIRRRVQNRAHSMKAREKRKSNMATLHSNAMVVLQNNQELSQENTMLKHILMHIKTEILTEEQRSKLALKLPEWVAHLRELESALNVPTSEAATPASSGMTAGTSAPSQVGTSGGGSGNGSIDTGGTTGGSGSGWGAAGSLGLEYELFGDDFSSADDHETTVVSHKDVPVLGRARTPSTCAGPSPPPRAPIAAGGRLPRHGAAQRQKKGDLLQPPQQTARTPPSPPVSLSSAPSSLGGARNRRAQGHGNFGSVVGASCTKAVFEPDLEGLVTRVQALVRGFQQRQAMAEWRFLTQTPSPAASQKSAPPDADSYPDSSCDGVKQRGIGAGSALRVDTSPVRLSSSANVGAENVTNIAPFPSISTKVACSSPLGSPADVFFSTHSAEFCLASVTTFFVLLFIIGQFVLERVLTAAELVDGTVVSASAATAMQSGLGSGAVNPLLHTLASALGMPLSAA